LREKAAELIELVTDNQRDFFVTMYGEEPDDTVYSIIGRMSRHGLKTALRQIENTIYKNI